MVLPTRYLRKCSHTRQIILHGLNKPRMSLDSLDDSSTYWIEYHVATQWQQIGALLDHGGIVPTLKHVSHTAMTPIIVLHIDTI